MRTGFLLTVALLALPLAAAADTTTWHLAFYGEAPCYGEPGKQVFTVTSTLSVNTQTSGYGIADYFQALVTNGGALPLTDNVGRTVFNLAGCGAGSVTTTEEATFTFLVYPGGSGIYYVTTNNKVNDNFCAGNAINVTVDPNKLLIIGNYADTAGTTKCSVGLAGPGGVLPDIGPDQPAPSPNPDCTATSQLCSLELNVPSTLKDAAEKKYYEVIFTATGGTKPYTYKILPADPPLPLDFPQGLKYGQFGDEFVIYGTPAGNYADDYIFEFGDLFSFQIQVTDHAGHSVSRLTGLTVVPQSIIQPVWRPLVLSAGTEGVPYFAYVHASGGDNISYTKHWTLVGNALPPGITMAQTSGSDLIFRGKPSAGSHGTYSFQVKVDDGFTYTDTAVLVIPVYAPKSEPLQITTTTLPAASQGDSINDQLGATGGTGSYTWTLGSAAPPGLKLSAQGVLSGSATRSSDAPYSFSAKVADSAGKTATQTIAIQINPPPGATLHFSSKAALPEAYIGAAFNTSIPVLGGIPPYTVSLDPASPALPSGLKLNPAGTLSGAPAKSGTVALIFDVKDSQGHTGKTTLSLTVSSGKAPAIASLSPSATVADSPAINLRVQGNGFQAKAKILWNGQALTTTGDDAELSALVPADLLTIAGYAQVAVDNGSGNELPALPFAVLSTQPSTLAAPAAGANVSDTIEFQWIRSTASQYSLQIGDHGVATNNLLNKSIAGTAGSFTATGLPTDGRTLYVRLGSDLGDGWHYLDYSFTTVRSALNPRAQTTVLLKFKNSLIYPVDITVNGTAIGAVKGSSTAQQNVTFTPPLMVSVEMERPRTQSGGPLGDEFKGFYSPIANPAQIVSFEIDNLIGSQSYFVPLFNNTTAADRVLGVNMGLVSENRCNCIIPAHTSNVTAGYYQLFSNSNVRLYSTSSPYSGSYVYFGSPDGSAANTFASSVEANTGRISLTIK